MTDRASRPFANDDAPLQKTLDAVNRLAQIGGMSDREIDAKFEAAEARTETKIARLEGKLDLVLQKVDGTRALIVSVVMPTLVGGLIAIFFGLFAVLQWSDARLFSAIELREAAKPPPPARPEPGK